MLQAPIFRKYNRPGERHVLFRDRETLNEPINCLIVQGRSDDFYAGAPIDRGFDPLPLLADEVENLETFLNASRHVGKVEVLRCGEHRGGFADALKNKLAERHWQLVHYAGHSAKGGAASRGFLVAGGDVTECIDANEFAAWSAHAQFVFLNSCRSADTYFVVQIVEKLIPAVLGYRWPIGDRPAMEFAQSFYRHLFDDSEVNRHIEYAYLQAKRDLHRWESLACSWAAPMLVMQLLQSAERA
jgi:CHAT domain-containing protein